MSLHVATSCTSFTQYLGTFNTPTQSGSAAPEESGLALLRCSLPASTVGFSRVLQRSIPLTNSLSNVHLWSLGQIHRCRRKCPVTRIFEFFNPSQILKEEKKSFPTGRNVTAKRGALSSERYTNGLNWKWHFSPLSVISCLVRHLWCECESSVDLPLPPLPLPLPPPLPVRCQHTRS